MASYGTRKSRKISTTQVDGPTPRWYSKEYLSRRGTRSAIGNVVVERFSRVPRFRVVFTIASYGCVPVPTATE